MHQAALAQIEKGNILNLVGRFVPVDLSADRINATDSAELEAYINQTISNAGAVAAYGGYAEKRNLYRDKTLFNDEIAEERNIHLGIDLWAPAGTGVISPIDGIVHSFDFNAGNGNYGPTIILEHNWHSAKFYTLYGHLSAESIEDMEIGETISRGSVFAELGDASINGGYLPHLHFQVILDIGDHFGDYPGVCSENNLEAFLANCPDPQILLNIPA